MHNTIAQSPQFLSPFPIQSNGIAMGNTGNDSGIIYHLVAFIVFGDKRSTTQHRKYEGGGLLQVRNR